LQTLFWNVTPEAKVINPCEGFNAPLSATKAPKKDGKGYKSIRNISIGAVFSSI